MIASHAELDAARLVGDPPADAVVADLGDDAWIVNAALRHAHVNGEPLPPAIPAVVRRFFDEHASLPPWFDQHRARRAQRWASARLFHVTASLFCASLPIAYAGARGARVLTSTGSMQGKRLDRRVNETAQFVMDVLADGGFSSRGSAIRAIQKVRLMHAAVRAHLVERGAIADEVPINQEDLLGTLFTFSVVVVRSLRLLGIPVDDEEADDHYQLWRVAGAMLGIDPRLLPVDFDEALTLGERIAARQQASSEHGRALMASLLAGMEEHVRLRAAPRWLVRYLVGDPVADLLGVPESPGFQSQLAVLRLLPRWSRSGLASVAVHLSPLVGRPLLEAVIAAKLGGAPPSFAMPSRTEAVPRRD